MERILTALGVTKQSSGMERDGLSPRRRRRRRRRSATSSSTRSTPTPCSGSSRCRLPLRRLLRGARGSHRDPRRRRAQRRLRRVARPRAGVQRHELRLRRAEGAAQGAAARDSLRPRPRAAAAASRADGRAAAAPRAAAGAVAGAGRPSLDASARGAAAAGSAHRAAPPRWRRTWRRCARRRSARRSRRRCRSSSSPPSTLRSRGSSRPTFEGSWPWGARAAATSVRKAWRRELEKLVGVLAREARAGAEDTKAEACPQAARQPAPAGDARDCDGEGAEDKTKVPNSKDRGKALALISTFAQPDGLQVAKRSLLHELRRIATGEDGFAGLKPLLSSALSRVSPEVRSSMHGVAKRAAALAARRAARTRPTCSCSCRASTRSSTASSAR